MPSSALSQIPPQKAVKLSTELYADSQNMSSKQEQQFQYTARVNLSELRCWLTLRLRENIEINEDRDAMRVETTA